MVAEVSTSEQSEEVFPCFCCGICCSKYQAYLARGEAQKLADGLGIPLRKFLDDYTDPRWPGSDTYLLKHAAEACVFLERKNDGTIGLCRIHDFKPDVCRQWAAGSSKNECRQGLKRYWDLEIDNTGEITGSPDKLERFQTCLKMLN
jgi:Fe-S-cluster containining protein